MAIPGPGDVGREIHYTGDVANQPARGRIVAYEPPGRWQADVVIEMTPESRPDIWHIYPTAFAAGPGRRFWFLDEWQAKQRAALACGEKINSLCIAQCYRVIPLY